MVRRGGGRVGAYELILIGGEVKHMKKGGHPIVLLSSKKR
jgi:hypothetical protein